MKRPWLLATVALLVGCFADDNFKGMTFEGTYALQSINGAPLPSLVSESGSVKTELLDEAYVFAQGLVFNRVSHVRTTTNGQATTATVNQSGYVVLYMGNSVYFFNSDGSNQRLGIVSDNSLTFSETGRTYVYRK